MKPDVPATQLDAWKGVLNAHAAVTGEVERRLAAAGLPPLSWYDVLWALRRAPGRSLRMLELARAVVTISPSGLTRLVDRIEAEGLLEAALTPEGTAMLRRMWPVYAGVLNQHVAAMLTEDEALAVAAGLGRVSDSARWDRRDRHPAVTAAGM